MNIKKLLSEIPNLVLDASVLLGYFMNEARNINNLLDEYIFNQESKIILFGHNLIKTELYYVLCRQNGITEAEIVLNKIENIMNMISDTWIFKKAAMIKCKYPIAISDCFSISLAILKECPVFFLPEYELSGDLIKDINNEYDSKILLV